MKDEAALGSQGVALTPGYSLAIDKKWIPLGAPLWLSTTRPDVNPDQEKAFQRLMIAQDTGGAIKGLVRGDVYWGAGEKATFIAGHMKNPGHYWLLLPNHMMTKLQKKIGLDLDFWVNRLIGLTYAVPSHITALERYLSLSK